MDGENKHVGLFTKSTKIAVLFVFLSLIIWVGLSFIKTGSVTPATVDAKPLSRPNFSLSSLPEFEWVRTGGPLGGLGYDIRVRPDNPDVMYVTDAWSGVHMSSDGGQTWMNVNDGIDARTGPSGDAIPVFSLTIDPNDNDIIWIGLQDLTGIYRSTDGGLTWEKRINGIVENLTGCKVLSTNPLMQA
jgi:hypothetical protein